MGFYQITALKDAAELLVLVVLNLLKVHILLQLCVNPLLAQTEL